MNAHPQSRLTRLPALWFGLVAGPLTWSGHLMASYLLDEGACALGYRESTVLGLPFHKALLGAFTVVAAVVTVAAGVVGYLAWRAAGAAHDPDELAPPVGRVQFMGLGGALVSGMFLVLILTEGVINIVLLRVCP
ncbi:MAG: hypothetical protein ACYDAD_14950 [Acidimicrobiales bacterium]